MAGSNTKLQDRDHHMKLIKEVLKITSGEINVKFKVIDVEAPEKA